MAKNHYINNKDFLQEMIKYRTAIKKAKRLGQPKPQIPTYVAKCFMMIAENLSHKPNFLSYTFRDEMVADAIENCVMYVDNFDPSKSSNPFAYFTQITYYAFLRRIQKEKKQLYVKYKSTETAGILDEFELNENEDGTFRQFELYENISEFISNYENARKAKKAKRAGLEKFVDEDSNPG
jgi:DNA-directed RNA polymerase specialized sigma24 family protein